MLEYARLESIVRDELLAYINVDLAQSDYHTKFRWFVTWPDYVLPAKRGLRKSKLVNALKQFMRTIYRQPKGYTTRLKQIVEKVEHGLLHPV